MITASNYRVAFMLISHDALCVFIRAEQALIAFPRAKVAGPPFPRKILRFFLPNELTSVPQPPNIQATGSGGFASTEPRILLHKTLHFANFYSTPGKQNAPRRDSELD
uniref:(northern house mosquito) hypothetical protein n=1 Tax=Culex pipiens TaxID=7175 RepID=A0A8D8H2N1_CULPI